MRNPGRLAGRMLALLMVVTPMAAAAAAREAPAVDLANLPPGQGFVFGSIEVQWPDQPALAKIGNSPEKVVEAYRIDAPPEGRAEQGGLFVRQEKPAFAVRPRVGEDKAFAQSLPAGHYLFTCLYHKDIVFGGPIGECYPVLSDFVVTPGKATYVGRIVLRMPAGMMSVHIDVSVNDDRAAAEARLAPKYGAALAAAETRLADWAGAREALRIEPAVFPRLAERIGQKEWTHAEEHHAGVTDVRTVIAGRSVDDWDIAFEMLQSERLNLPVTPQEWLKVYRASSDARCPGTWDVLAETRDSVLFQRRTGDCPPFRAQEALYRMMYGHANGCLLICTQMGTFDEATRQDCRALLESARIEAR